MKSKNKKTLKGSFEPQVVKQLKRLKVKFDYEPHKLEYTLVRPYTPDFIVYLSDGSYFYIEAKGYFRWDDQRKMRLIKEQNPGLDIRLLFMQNNKISKSSKMRYSDWADKYGFKYAIGEIPKEWLK